jgi:hypothetical protein
MKRAPIFAFALLISIAAAQAWADGPSDAPQRAPSTASVPQLRAEARALAERGDAQFEAGRCDKAIALWKDADARFHAPTIQLRIARCQAFLGRVVAAAATLEAIRREPIDPAAPAPFIEAKRQAEQELVGIRARIATLRISFQRAKGVTGAPTIEIDQESLPGAEDADIAVDPGQHLLRVRASEVLWERKVTFNDGEVQTYRLSLWSESPPSSSRPQRQVGLAVGGVGIASLAAGIGFAAAASAAAHQRGARPRSEIYSRVADFTLVGGGVLFATGAILLMAEPRPRDEPPRLRVSTSAWALGLSGSFPASPGVGLWIAGAY